MKLKQIILLCFCVFLFGISETGSHAGVGGGFAGAGLTGKYYPNTTWSGSPSFVRKDLRLDFGLNNVSSPSGVGQTGEPGYQSVGATNWSAVWTGQVIPRFTETYTFKVSVDDNVVVNIRAAGDTTWTTLINCSAPGTATGTYVMAAGKKYDIQVSYVQTTGSWGISLQWSSSSTPLEVIDVLADIGLNVTDPSTIFTDIVKCARNSWWNATGMDANGWPTSDCGYVFQESLNQGLDIDPLMQGTIAFQFNGSANVSVQGNCGNLNCSYNAVNNLTSGTFTVSPRGSNASFFNITNSHRNGLSSGSAGITNLKLMRPTSPNSTTSMDTNTVFTQASRDAVSHFTVLRYQYVANQQVNWSERTLPSFFNQNGGAKSAPHYGVGDPSDNGMAWEYKVMFCNETGRDLMISIPTVASGVSVTDTSSYIYKLACLIKYGSDGVNPYTSPQANPVFAPLNPNLRVYLELENELWNWGGPFYTDFANINAIINADKAANNSEYQALNYDNVNDINTQHTRYSILRMMQISNIFRAVFGTSAMMTRVRPLYEWQYDNANGTASNALEFADEFFNNGDGISHVTVPHPVSYYLWGGGGATYYGAVNSVGATKLMPNSSFASPALSAFGYTQAPSGGGWTYTGTAGIAKNGGANSDIPKAYSGTQMAYITDKGAISISVTFPSNATTSTYGIAFKAVNRTKSGASSADTENIRVLVDGNDICARSFNQGNGYQPVAYDPSDPWYANVVFWARSQYYNTKSFIVAPGTTHTITIKGMGDINNTGNTNQTAFIGEVRITSADPIFNDGIPGGGEAAGQPAGLNYQNTLNVEANWAKAFGLQEFSYEGGWSLGGDDGGSWIQLLAKYGDSRTTTAQVRSLNMFYNAGSAVTVLGTYAQWPSWADYYAEQGLLDVSKYPIIKGVDQYLNQLPADATNGLPAPISLSLDSISVNKKGDKGNLSTPGYVCWNVVLPYTAYWTVSATTTSGGTAILLVDDIYATAKTTSGTTLSKGAILTKGLHTVKVKALQGSFSVSSAQIAVNNQPDAPQLTSAVDSNGSITLNWTPVTGATRYIVYYGNASKFYATVWLGNVTSYNVTGLTNNYQYYFAIRAVKNGLISFPSNVLSAIPLADGNVSTLLGWDFVSDPGNQNPVSPILATSRITASSLSRGSGLQDSGYDYTYIGGSFAFYPVGNVYGATLADAISKNQYAQFTIAPVSGKKLNLKTLVFYPYFQNPSGCGAGITYSKDGVNFSSGIAASGTPSSAPSLYTVDLGTKSDFQNVTGTITIRIYLYGCGSWTFEGIGKQTGNDLYVIGSFVSTP